MSARTDLINALTDEFENLSPTKTASEAATSIGNSISDFAETKEVPIGSIIAWHKSLTGTPALPPNWAECNGQTVTDTESPYYDEALPNLNGSSLFLRGASASGSVQSDAFQGHYQPGTAIRSNVQPLGTSGTPWTAVRADGVGTLIGRSPVSDGVNGTPRIASETRPANMSVVWIIKIKSS